MDLIIIENGNSNTFGTLSKDPIMLMAGGYPKVQLFPNGNFGQVNGAWTIAESGEASFKNLKIVNFSSKGAANRFLSVDENGNLSTIQFNPSSISYQNLLDKTTMFSGSYNDLTNKPTEYSLPKASAANLEGVKVGANLSIDADGILSSVLPSSGVTPGTYTNANITVDEKGRVTNATNGTGSSEANPVGTIILRATSNVPAGYLACDGAAVSRNTYAALFAIIGVSFGDGNNSSTFNLPKMKSTSIVYNVNHHDNEDDTKVRFFIKF